MKPRNVYAKILAGSRNVRFGDACKLANAFGFRLDRTSGSHHIFVHPSIPHNLNFQPDHNGQAKPYQLRQLIALAEEYGLMLED